MNKTLIFLFLFFSTTTLFDIDCRDVVFALERPNILFIHHSVGNSLIRDGSVREILTEAGFDFWDHGYNHPKLGLRNEKGEPAGCYWIPQNNTYPDGLASLFSLDPKKPNALNRILNNHDLIAFKSCFPASKIEKDNMTEDLAKPGRRSVYNYKRHYLRIRNTVDKYQEKIFIVVTQPPLHPSVTNKDEAQRARTFVEWLQSEDYLGNRKNLFVFDYFDLLAEPKTDMLRNEYQIDPRGKNSHPNPIANMLIGPHFADFIVNIFKYKNSSNLPRVTFNIPQWPDKLIRLFNPTLTLRGEVISDKPIKRLFWSDLKGQGGELVSSESWNINGFTVSHGVTKVVVTAINQQGLRSSSVIGLQYYSGKAKQEIIFDESLKCGILSGMSYSEENPYVGKKHLIIMGNGQHKRVAINEIALDISDFDPKSTYLEIHYDQGRDIIKPMLGILGIGGASLDVDGKPGYERIIIPFDKFSYVYSVIDGLIMRGKWARNTKVYLDSIKIICSGRAP